MEKIASDDYFDYYEANISGDLDRVCYYFEMQDADERLYLYADTIAADFPEDRTEVYQFPFIRREEISDVPHWLKEAVVYNIFPDSFADSKRGISCAAKDYFDEKTGQTLHTRLGGTIRGIIENLDYIEDLGFNCLYLNPIFTAAEYHRYDLLDYYHVCPNLGTDDDFRELVSEVHNRGMHIIIDGVFNHSSWYFFAFDDVVKNGENSQYKDWFYGLKFPVKRPEDGERPSYTCFAYERKMPKLNTSNPQVRNYFMDVCRYWLEDFDVDGWRLDVANEVDKDFWRAFRTVAKKTKKDSVLIAEIWENSERWLQGDMFDSTMNYEFRKVCRDFFAFGKINAREFNSRFVDMLLRYPFPIVQGQLNLLDSHDVSRFRSLCAQNSADSGDSCEQDKRFRLAELCLLTSVGTPSVFYGDELGVVGFEECDYRAAMPWANPVKDNRDLFRELIKLRKSNDCFVHGNFRVLDYDERGKFVFARETSSKRVVVALNAFNESNDSFSVLPDCKPIISYNYDAQNHSIGAFGYAIFEVK
ncbi:alpha amylase, catalytic domain protein [Gardnerella vaginalis]|uniref:Alpha amylase, catalytic domain protein n=2 Tax=Gardnerella vaginalis TaxID=2702 RepID=A0A133NQ25_GARVA|nr:alpha amylase, catalytic domain protein [Gardnerella vaginalis]